MNQKIADGWTVEDVTRRVKGSSSGWGERKKLYDEFLGVLG